MAWVPVGEVRRLSTESRALAAAIMTVTMWGSAFVREGMPGQLLLGCVVAFLGTALIAASSGGGATGPTTGGVTLCLLAAVAYAAAATLQKRALQRVPAAWVNVIGMSAACVVCVPFVPGLTAELTAAGPRQWGWLVYLGVFPTALGFTTWAYALARTSAGRTAAVNYLISPLTIVLGWLLLAELPTFGAIVGGAICVAGVALARSKSLPRLRAATNPRRSAGRSAP